MKKVIRFAIVAALCITACNRTQNQEIARRGTDSTNTNSVNVEYTLAKNYFVRNDADLSGFSSPAIETQEAFDAIFGPATIMGDEGVPTPVDFNRKYAIAIINPITDRATELEIEQVQKSGELVTVTYTETKGEKQSLQIRPFLLLLLDRGDEGRVEVVRK